MSSKQQAIDLFNAGQKAYIDYISKECIRYLNKVKLEPSLLIRQAATNLNEKIHINMVSIIYEVSENVFNTKPLHDTALNIFILLEPKVEQLENYLNKTGENNEKISI